MASFGAQYDAPRFPPAETDLQAMRKRRTFHTAFGDVPMSARFWFQKKFIKWWILLVLICVLVVLMTVFHHQIVRWLEPFAQDLHNLTAGWAIPIAILFVLSFPPLFGHEIVAILCGLVWGLWEGFGIVSAGTLLGEWGTFYAFRYFLTKRARRMEAKDLNFACMVRLVEKGGFWTVFLARLSAIPGHLTTAVFATTRISFWTFTLAAVLSMPKQLMTVYLGTVFNEEENGTRSTASKVVTDVILVFSFFVTIAAAVYLYKKMAEVRPQILAERKLKEQEAAEVEGLSPVEGYSNRLTPYSSKQDLHDDEHVSLARNGFMPAGHDIERLPYNAKGQLAPQQPYAATHFNRSNSSSIEDDYDPRSNQLQAYPPPIVVQSPSDPTLAARVNPANLARPPSNYYRVPDEYRSTSPHSHAVGPISHGEAL